MNAEWSRDSTIRFDQTPPQDPTKGQERSRVMATRPPDEHETGKEAMSSLKNYLSRMRALTFPQVAGKHIARRTALVMGNPSADLDSFISAVTASYFYNLRSSAGGRYYIPVLNLPSVKSKDLWRLRPEFGVALRLATGESTDSISQGEKGTEGKTPLLEELITIADIKNDEKSSLHKLFTVSDQPQASQQVPENERQNLFLVDHNAPSIPGLSEETISSRFTLTGCIDHHVDESVIPKAANPRIITTGIGSCTSLVVQHLRDEGLWPGNSTLAGGDTQAIRELSKLALAPILIDTNNLKATGDKCSDLDRSVVKFLESNISDTISTTSAPSQSSSQSSTPWDRSAFHSTISSTKSNSLNLLTMPEIFDRDYKAWSETPSSSSSSDRHINIGISSLVKPLSWLIEHAGSVQNFVDEIEKFGADEERKLGVYCMLTRTGDGRKEVLVVRFADGVEGVVQEFDRVGGELQLGNWEQHKELMNELDEKFGEWKIWFVGDTSKSRKQVGPLLREAVKKI